MENQMSTFKRPSHQLEDSGISLFRDLKLKRRRILDLVSSDTESCISNGSRKSIGSESTSSGYVSDCDRLSDVSMDSLISSSKGNDCSSETKKTTLPNEMGVGYEEKQKFEEFSMKIKVEGDENGQMNVPFGIAYVGFPPGLMAWHPQIVGGVNAIENIPAVNMIPVMTTMPDIMTSTPAMTTLPALVTAFPKESMMNANLNTVPVINFTVNRPQMSTYSASQSVLQLASGSCKNCKYPEPLPHKGQEKNYRMNNRPSSNRISNNSEYCIGSRFSSSNDCISEANLVEYHTCHHGSDIETRDVDDDTDNEEPMICAICNDRATGLHYGIITCEGCKGFFKRTVQNKRVYNCVANGDCEINKMQRNRCQYCRFKKCLQMGMVLAAVREDRMPGGRNSGAVYNLYKVKYKKHKRKKQQTKFYKQRVAHISVDQNMHIKTEPVNMKDEQDIPIDSSTAQMSMSSAVVHKHLNPNGCTTTATTNCTAKLAPCNTRHSYVELISELIQCDCLLDIADACKLDELVNDNIVSCMLFKIGDTIVNKLVKWTRQLPFYHVIPLEVHSQILIEKWHELLLLITTAHKALSNGSQPASFQELYQCNMSKLSHYLNRNFKKFFTMDELNSEIGEIVDKISHIMAAFVQMNLTKEEYVCIQVILLLNQNQTMPIKEVERIQDQYTVALQQYIHFHYPHEPNRFGELLLRLPEIQTASTLLLKSKMIYVPFLLTS